LEFFSSGIEIP